MPPDFEQLLRQLIAAYFKGSSALGLDVPDPMTKAACLNILEVLGMYDLPSSARELPNNVRLQDTTQAVLALLQGHVAHRDGVLELVRPEDGPVLVELLREELWPHLVTFVDVRRKR